MRKSEKRKYIVDQGLAEGHGNIALIYASNQIRLIEILDPIRFSDLL